MLEVEKLEALIRLREDTGVSMDHLVDQSEGLDSQAFLSWLDSWSRDSKKMKSKETP